MIIPLIIQSILLDPLGAVRADWASNVNRPDPSGVDQIDVKRHATELAVGRTPVILLVTPPSLLGPTGAHRLKCAPDLTCEDGTAQHVLDGGEATHDLPGDRVVPIGTTSGSGSSPAGRRSDGLTIGSRQLECSAMERITIRHVRASDAAELARNWIEVAQHYVELDPQAFRVPSTDGLVEFFEKSLNRPRSEDSVWLVAEVDGQVVGDVSAHLERPAEDAERQLLRYLGEVRIYVDALGVVQVHRRRGVGTRLMQAIERWARERGAVCAMLDTHAASPLSVPFYERGMGYRRRSIVFEKRLD